MGKVKKEKNRLSLPSLPSLNLSIETKRSIAVIVFVVLAGITAMSVVNLAGSFGAMIIRVLLIMFGVIAYVVPVLLSLVAFTLFRQHLSDEDDGGHFYARTYIGMVLFTGSLAGLIHVFFITETMNAWVVAGEGRAGGYLGAVFSAVLFSLFGFWGTLWILFFLLTAGILVAFNVPLKVFIPKRTQVEEKVKAKEVVDVKINTMADQNFVIEKVADKAKKAVVEDEEFDDEVEEGLKETVVVKTSTVNLMQQSLPPVEVVNQERKDWKLPALELLEDGSTEVDSGNIEANVKLIEKTLADFGIGVEMGEVNVGPTVTQYTFRPNIGVKLSQIDALKNDLALALSAQSLRMELPIPGKPLVGVEIPNVSASIVRLRSVMNTNDFLNSNSKLLLALGRDVAGKTVYTDLAKMPHLLIAGATGTGKSVAINSLFISLLFRNTPQDVKFIVIDPKRVELNLYNGIPHLLTPVVTDHEKAINALKWAVGEMDRRYKLLAEANKRNISEYNEMIDSKLSYIVILVDELADLMAVAQADVEASIVRLAQMARAVGIHLVLATQRPSVEIITGLIKANVTSRIAFKVASQIDSRTILDSSGAEKLLGNGDMLFISADFTKPKRIQGAYVGEKEVKKVVDFFKQQAGAVLYNDEILEKPKKGLNLPGYESDDGDDDLFEEAKDVVLKSGKASASLLQRRLRVGYARAARLIDILEQKGIIGPGDGAKPREVFGVIPSEEKAEYGIEEEV